MELLLLTSESPKSLPGFVLLCVVLCMQELSTKFQVKGDHDRGCAADTCT